jgi:hypothetical protein
VPYTAPLQCRGHAHTHPALSKTGYRVQPSCRHLPADCMVAIMLQLRFSSPTCGFVTSGAYCNKPRSITPFSRCGYPRASYPAARGMTTSPAGSTRTHSMASTKLLHRPQIRSANR